MPPGRTVGLGLEILVIGLACTAFLMVAIEDIRGFRIRNSRILALLGLFAASSAISGEMSEIAWQALFALVALCVMVAAFTLGGIGAGDVKLMTVACLWIGPGQALVFAAMLTVLTLGYGIGAATNLLPARRAGRAIKIPFGVSISGASITVIGIIPILQSLSTAKSGVLS